MAITTADDIEKLALTRNVLQEQIDGHGIRQMCDILQTGRQNFAPPAR